MAPGNIENASRCCRQAVSSRTWRRPYQITSSGAAALRDRLQESRRIARLGLDRIAHLPRLGRLLVTWRRLVHWILALYPGAWRDRYGHETATLVDDLLADPHPRPHRLAFNLLLGALRERAHPTVALRQRRSALMQHRNLLGLHRQKRLDHAGLALLEPDEQLIGTFDAITNHPSVREASITLTGLGLWLPLIGLTNGQPLGGWLIPASAFAAFGLLGLGFCQLTGSHWVMFAITSQGLVKCHLDLLGRPRSILGRSPAAVPEVLQQPLGWRRIALADTTVWVKYSLDPVLVWMRKEYADAPDERPPTAARGRAALWSATAGIGSAAAGLAALVGLVIWSSR